MTDGITAVQSFYIISGFYIALILNTKYIGVGSVKAFYLNRFFRLFPLYWVALALSFVGSLIWYFYVGNAKLLDLWFNWHPKMSLSAVFLGVLTNLVLMFQDVFMFLQLNFTNGQLEFTKNFWSSTTPAYKLLLVPQGWTLSIEILFYLLAPWVLRRGAGAVFLLLSLSLLLRTRLYSHGFSYDPWIYRFFPTEIAFFSAGALSFHLYDRYVARARLRRELLWFLGCAPLAATLFFPFLPFKAAVNEVPAHAIAWSFYALIALTIPFLFHLSRSWKIDSFIGEFSYPMYLSHVAVLSLIPSLVSPGQIAWPGILAIMMISFLLVLIQRPFERMREARARPFSGRMRGVAGARVGAGARAKRKSQLGILD